MANNYRQFSFALKLKSKKEVEWFKKRLDKARESEDDYGDMHDFDAVVYPTSPEDKNEPHVWFTDTGEYGNIDHIVIIVQEYLAKFNPKGYFLMTWADYCSKHRLDEFGGGFCIVMANRTAWSDEHKVVEKVAKGLERVNHHGP